MSTARRKAVTLADVAAAAGVSRSTASRALNHSPRISRSTTEKVARTAADLGFVPNARGQALAMGRTDMIAILITEPIEELFTDPTYGAIIGGITSRLAESSWLPVLLQAAGNDERHHVRRHLERHGFDAVIDISPYADSTLLDEMQRLHIPGVLLGQMENQPYEGVFSIVYSDDVSGARLAARAMRDRGRTHPVAILGPENNPASMDRLRGYRDIYGDVLSDERVLCTEWGADAGFASMMWLLEQHITIDGVLAGSDRIAVGALEALRQNGRSVPDDVSVIGFDDHPLAMTTRPPLTTVHQPLREEGSMAADVAMRMIDGQPPSTTVMHMQLMRRASL